MSNASAPSPSPIVPGSVLAGKYRVERILGQGGMGVVVEARHIALDERVALKVLLPELAGQTEPSARFLREARNVVKIKSEHVARVSDVGTLDGGLPFMVMELLEGRDLEGTLQQTGVLPIPDAVDYIIQGCEAIAEAHSLGIVHRDLKPANMFLARRPDGSPVVKVLDFGLSKGKTGSQADALTRTTTAMGSALYMSPEQMQQTRSVDHRTDIYALGVSLYELLAGRQPFFEESLPQLCIAVLTGTPTPIKHLRADVPDALAAVLERAYARDRAARHQSIGELVAALAPFAPARSAPSIERIARLSGLPVPEAPAVSGVFAAPGPVSQPIPSAQPISAAAAPQPISRPQPISPPQACSPAPPPASLGGTQLLAEPMPIPGAARNGTIPMPAMDPTAGPPRPDALPANTAAPPPPPPPPPNPNQIVPGHYSAPMSVRAAASFKQGALAGPMIHGRPANRAALLLLLGIAALAIAGIVAALVLRARAGHSDPDLPATPPPASAPR